MAEDNAKIEAERQMLVDAQAKGKGATLWAFSRLSGPGWLQSAITLGGGSLAASLYLGVLAGFGLLWLQPFAMILGIVMLSAIGYIALSTKERPFQAINKHVNPVLGWSWAIACLMANMVWCLPQFSLANSVLQQNLLPEVVGAGSELGEFWGKVVIAGVILVITVLITWSYGSGHWGIKLYEALLKLVVVGIVVCFLLVVIYMSRAGALDWGGILWGFVPDPSRIFQPATAFTEHLDAVDPAYRQFWSDLIVNTQIDRTAAAAATAVGINMTFLFPYSLIRKGWTKEYRGLQKFDLCTGMFIPFVLATSCVVIAAKTQFHAEPVRGLVKQESDDEGNPLNATGKEIKNYRGIMTGRLKQELGDDGFKQLVSGEAPFAKLAEDQPELIAALNPADRDALKKKLGEAAVVQKIQQTPEKDRTLAAMLVERDANRLAQSLAPLTGGDMSNVLFGAGVIGMTLSTISLLMLISGFVICEVFNLKPTGWTFRLACLPAAVGVLGPFVWSKAGFALAIPTSVFGLMLLPIAYLTFFLLLNQKSLLGDELPRGRRRVVWNILMAVAAGIATAASLYMVWSKVREKGLIAIGVLLGLALIVQIRRWIRGTNRPTSNQP